ncbi:gliding motility-associated protein GldM [Catalinimonas alkaloidigena]|uniref:Gliding motility-associated protein GldM n=1 Tax=Catalinimonas alkaloidigena TaxID=1075417 RepID=A0A1G9MNE9_9BACT|nr:gliding motility protein GldM [Catalinimonas alkaloidigena]SDL75798.1 gliding motility-associated protein GldM [Catalinimonas alkaloidigena]
MAGGKETPRQKLINLMYLVLLAMLALQVSSAIIQKFVFLNKSLENALAETVQRNETQISGIEQAVTQRDNQPKEVKILETAKDLRSRSKTLIEEMEGIKAELITMTGGEATEGVGYNGAKNEDEVAQLMIGPGDTKKGKAYELKSKLNQYTEFLNGLVQQHNLRGIQAFSPLALDAKEDPITKKDKEQKSKDFAQLNFESTPMVAALAVLTDKQSKVATYEATVLNALAAEVGATDIKLGQLIPMARAESRVVAAGTKYRAEMFISGVMRGANPVMRYEGKPLEVDSRGVGVIEFTAAGGNYDADDKLEKTWTAEIVAPDPVTGKDSVYKLTEKYIVAKPVMQIQSASVQALYRNCGNDLSVQVPALGATYDPSFNVKGGSSIKGGKKGEVVVIPTEKSVTLTVSSGGSVIGSQEFNVRPVPKPEIVPYVGNRPANVKIGENGCPRSITMQAIPDDDFKAQLPKEARYGVTAYEVTLARGKRGLGKVDSRGPQVDLSSLAAKAQPGDRLVIEVKEVKRRNFQDKVEDINIGTSSSIINIPIN